MNQEKNGQNDKNGFKWFALKRLGLIAAAGFFIIGITAFLFAPVDVEKEDAPMLQTEKSTAHDAEIKEHQPEINEKEAGDKEGTSGLITMKSLKNDTLESEKNIASHKTGESVVKEPEVARVEQKQADSHAEPKPADKKDVHAAPVQLGGKTEEVKPIGLTFVEAAIKPLSYELTERFWGWRPNDIILVGDNVKNFQLGVLEVSRRTSVVLAERISRTGITAAFDRNLENAMNWFMIKAEQYWFPSPESKYRAGLDELKAYGEKLKRKEASFYTRSDNLIPLLIVFQDLLGSCDENLVKHYEENGEEVSVFKADNYFFYAKGVASAMSTILEAVEHDFYRILESRNAAELLHHAGHALKIAVSIDPWVITEGNLDGILANHRANMAAPISHARFYIGVLIKTLST